MTDENHIRDAAQAAQKHSPDDCGRQCQYYEFFDMLWKWFEERGAIDRYDWSDGKSADDFKVMLDEHEAELTAPPRSSAGNADALRLLAAEDERQSKLHELLETIREQIRLEVAPEHRPEGLFKNIQDAVYAMRGRTRLMDDAAITHAIQSRIADGRTDSPSPAIASPVAPSRDEERGRTFNEPQRSAGNDAEIEALERTVEAMHSTIEQLRAENVGLRNALPQQPATAPLMDAGSICGFLHKHMPDQSLASLAVACRALADHLRVLRAVPQTLGQWQPIDTAPREPDAMFMVCAVGDARGPFVVRSDILWRAREAGTPSHLGLDYLTHWMPLPEMPQ